MITTDDLNYELSGGDVKVLGIDDVLTDDVFIRRLIYDEYNVYRPDGYDSMMWHKIKVDLGGWIGKTYRDYLNHGGTQDNEVIHEMIRERR